MPAESREANWDGDRVRFLSGFLDLVGHRSAHVVGSSLGGVIAAFTAVRSPELVRSLTLVDSAGLGPEIGLSQRLLSLPLVGELVFRPSVQRVRKMLLRNQDAASEELIQALHLDRFQPGVARQMLGVPRAGVNLFGVKRSVQLTPHLPNLQMPVLVVWGRDDPLFPVKHAYRAADAAPNATLRVFDGVGHWVYLEDPEGFNRSLLGFLDGVESPGKTELDHPS